MKVELVASHLIEFFFSFCVWSLSFKVSTQSYWSHSSHSFIYPRNKGFTKLYSPALISVITLYLCLVCDYLSSEYILHYGLYWKCNLIGLTRGLTLGPFDLESLSLPSELPCFGNVSCLYT